MVILGQSNDVDEQQGCSDLTGFPRDHGQQWS